MTATIAGPLDVVLSKVAGARQEGDQWVALCPAHGDSRPSLGIAEGEKGVIFNCRSHACTTADICAALGLSVKELFFDFYADRPVVRRPKQAPVSAEQIAALSEYVVNASRRLSKAPRALEELARRFGIDAVTADDLGLGYDPGSSVVIRPDFLRHFGFGAPRLIIPMANAAGAVLGLQGRAIGLADDAGKLKRWEMPYGSGWSRLACFGIGTSGPVIVCEGLTDPLAVVSAGFAAIGIRGAQTGKNAVEPLLTEIEPDREIVVTGDVDAAGETFLLDVSSALAAAGRSVKRLVPPAEYGDLANWCEKIGLGAFRTALGQALRLAEPVERLENAESDSTAVVLSYAATDLGNARRIVAAADGNLRFVPEWGIWLVWNEGVWVRDVLGAAERVAKTLTEIIETEAAREPEEIAKSLRKWHLRSQSAGTIRAGLSLATTEPGIPVRVDELDANHGLLNLANGILDLDSGEFRPHDRAALCTHNSSVVYDPSAAAPLWETFLRRIFADDEELIEFVSRAVGYSMTGYCNEQVLFFCHGGGQNGKSTFARTLQSLLGSYAIQAAPNLLIQTQSNEHPTAIADLKGKRLVIASETNQGVRLDESLVKQLTGGDLVKARYMRQDFFEFAPTHKIWLAANHKPTIRGTDYAIWRRIRLIPFTVRILDSEKDDTIGDRLLAELPGILNWSLRGLATWRIAGLGAARAVVEATAEYRSESDVVGRFLEERCVFGDDRSVSAKTLREAYTDWCGENGERAMSAKAFAPHLVEHGAERTKDGYKRSIWLKVGLGLSDPSDRSDPYGISPENNKSRKSLATDIAGYGSDGSKGSDPNTRYEEF